MVNHFENNRGITTKTGLIRSLKQFYKSYEPAINANYVAFDAIATSFTLTAGFENSDHVAFVTRFKEIQRGYLSKEHVPQKHCPQNIWLIKPANQNQGRGIEIFRNLKDITGFLATRQPGSFWVAQKYIERPMLYKGRKFDLRIWALVTARGELFYYRTGYMRTSSFTYSTDAQDNYVHLTNNCLQQKGDSYGQHEDGNTLPIDVLFEYMKEQYGHLAAENKIDFKTEINQRIKNLIIDSYLSVKRQMVNAKRDYTFELFGYDFLVDEDLRVWLIEVNTNPYLGVANDFIRNLLPRLIDDMLKIVVDPIFPPKNKGDPSAINNFELLYCEAGSQFNNGQYKNIRQPYTAPIYPLEQLAQPPNRLLNVKSGQFEGVPGASHRPSDKLSISPQRLNNATNSVAQQSSTATLRPLRKSGSAGKFDRTNAGASTNVAIQNLLLSNTTVNGNRFRPSVENISANQLLSPSPADGAQGEEVAQQAARSKKEKHGKELFNQLKKLIQTYPYSDFEPFYKHVHALLNKMSNWELLSEKEISWTIQAMHLIIDSRVASILAEPRYIDWLIKIIDSQNYPFDIQLLSFEALKNVCRSASNKKLVLSRNIAKSLIKIVMSSLDENERDSFDKQLKVKCIECLCALGGIYNRKMYIPGETRDNDEARKNLTESGGLLALIFIYKKCSASTQPEIFEAVREFVENLDIQDFEYQLSIMREWEKRVADNGPAGVILSQPNIAATFSGDEEFVGRNDNNFEAFATAQNTQRDRDTVKSPLKYFEKQFTALQCAQLLEEIVNERREQISKWERLLKEKKDQEMQELKRLELERIQQQQEKREKLQEQRKRRDEEQKRKQLELKKKEELEREQIRREEETKRKKFEELLKKREETLKQKRREEEVKLKDDEKRVQKQHALFLQKRDETLRAYEDWEKHKYGANNSNSNNNNNNNNSSNNNNNSNSNNIQSAAASLDNRSEKSYKKNNFYVSSMNQQAPSKKNNLENLLPQSYSPVVNKTLEINVNPQNENRAVTDQSNDKRQLLAASFHGVQQQNSISSNQATLSALQEKKKKHKRLLEPITGGTRNRKLLLSPDQKRQQRQQQQQQNQSNWTGATLKELNQIEEKNNDNSIEARITHQSDNIIIKDAPSAAIEEQRRVPQEDHKSAPVSHNNSQAVARKQEKVFLVFKNNKPIIQESIELQQQLITGLLSSHVKDETAAANSGKRAPRTFATGSSKHHLSSPFRNKMAEIAKIYIDRY